MTHIDELRAEFYKAREQRNKSIYSGEASFNNGDQDHDYDDDDVDCFYD